MRLMGKSLGLVFGLAPLLFLISCEDPGLIGLDVDSDNLEFQIKYQKLAVPATLVQIDSVSLDRSGRMLVGKYIDPEFGVIQATAYSQTFINAELNVIPESAIYDSLVLRLKLDYIYGTNVQITNDLEIYRLFQELDPSKVYITTDSTAVFQDPIGTIAFEYGLKEVDGIETAVTDTIFSVFLSDALGQEILDRGKDSNDSTIRGTSYWQNFFKGFAFRAGDRYSSITGFAPDDNDSEMILYYHFDEDGTIVERTIKFPLNNTVHYTGLNTDRTGTAIENVTEIFQEYDAQDGNIYVRAGTGLVTKLDFGPFISFSDTIENLIINHTELKIQNPESTTPYQPVIDKLLYFFTDGENRSIRNDDGFLKTVQADDPVIDPLGVSFPLETSFDEDSLAYISNISNTLQAIYDGRIEEDAILVFPTTQLNTTTLNRFKVAPEDITLEVFYTVVEDNKSNSGN